MQHQLTRRAAALMTALVFTLGGAVRAQHFAQTSTPEVNRQRGTDSPDPDNGPGIRVALMTDIASVTLSCSSGLKLRSRSDSAVARPPDDEDNSAPQQVRVEVRQIARPKDAARSPALEKGQARKPPSIVAVESGTVVASDPASLIAEPSSDLADHRGKDAETHTDREKGRSGDGAKGRRGDPETPGRKKDGANPGQNLATNSSLAASSSPVRPISTSPVLFSASPPPSVTPFIRVGGKPYRGAIEVAINSSGRINVINEVSVEDYLRGVLPMELSPIGYPEIEALKAQAVAARSYALYHRGDHDVDGYDLRDDARSQVYGGVTAEHELSDRAIDETRGLVAASKTADNRWTPIDAMYTANCGGHTENNEDVFGGTARAYLRGVACQADETAVASREIVSSRASTPIAGADGRSIAREVALLQVLSVPIGRVTLRYLASPLAETEYAAWIGHMARLSRQRSPQTLHDPIRMDGFCEAAVAAIYGYGRASVLITPADAAYILEGLERDVGTRTRSTSQQRCSVAFLLKTGALKLPADAVLYLDGSITRATAIETLARAFMNRFRSSVASTSSQAASQSGAKADSKPDSKADSTANARREGVPRSSDATVATRSAAEIGEDANLTLDTADGISEGRLLVASRRRVDGLEARNSSGHYVKVESDSSRVSGKDRAQSSNAPSKDVPFDRPSSSKQSAQPTLKSPNAGPREIRPGLEVEPDAWLFRDIAGESYQVTSITLIGGESLVYHLDARGRVDFLESGMSERSAAADRYSRVAAWQHRLPAAELTKRLSSRGRLGDPIRLVPVSFSGSGRVTALEIEGRDGNLTLRGGQIKSVLGLRENMFVVDSEKDETGRVIAFVFTGRGWGHGVGMCQTGAYGLAREGYSYVAILQTYYTGIKVQKLY